jgi:putative ABC transport system permease protein
VVTPLSGRIVVIAPTAPDSADQPTAADRLSIGFVKAGLPASATVVERPTDTTGLILAAAAAATLLMALLAGLMVTALALADGRSDLATLAAVGAKPGVRRRIAASSAGFVSALGCAAGVVSGLVLAKLLVGLVATGSSRVFAVHWWLVIGVLVAIPLVTAGVAWLTTRSRVVLTRRTDF